MYEFTYHRPTRLDEAAALIKKAEEGKLLSGGQTLIPTLKLRLASASDVIDLTGLKNRGIIVGNGKVTVQAGTTHAEVETSKDVQKSLPALASLAGCIGDPQVRHAGTIGGSIANNDPAADYPAAVVGLNATVVTNQRRIEAETFFRGMFETALNRDEIITAVEFPLPKRAAYEKFRNPASRFALVGVFVAELSNGEVRVAVTGAGPVVYRAKAMEKALGKGFSADSLKGVSASADGLNADIHASAEYRAHLVGVLARRAVAAAK